MNVYDQERRLFLYGDGDNLRVISSTVVATRLFSTLLREISICQKIPCVIDTRSSLFSLSSLTNFQSLLTFIRSPSHSVSRAIHVEFPGQTIDRIREHWANTVSRVYVVHAWKDRKRGCSPFDFRCHDEEGCTNRRRGEPRQLLLTLSDI